MDWEIRLALILGGLILVGYIYFDFQKKKKRQVENERLKEKFRNMEGVTDGEGLDLTGVGTARPAEASDENQVSNVSGSTIDEFIERRNESKQKPSIEDGEGDATSMSQDEVIEAVEEKTDLFESVSANNSVKKEPEIVFSLLLQAKVDDQYLGKDLLPLFLSQGLRHGDMDIFHRHLKIKGKPTSLLFSLANGIAPGTFSLKEMDDFKTPALAFFMTLPGPQDPQIAYDAMYKTIKLLNKELGGVIYDETHSKYTQQTHNHRLDQIQEFVRGSLAH